MRPEQVHPQDFGKVEVVTQANIGEIIAQVERGERDPINWVVFDYTEWLDFAKYMASVKAALWGWHDYADNVEKAYKEAKADDGNNQIPK